MAELEKTIEDKLIEQLTEGKSQWTYRPDLHTEEELWANLRSILERGNKAVLDGKPLTDQEFEQVKNQLSFATFYDAAKWIAGENGIAHVYVQRDTETVQLTALKRDDIAGGSSVYEVINQYRALKDDDEENVHSQNRRFDVSLLINGIPLIHIELKNRQHSYLDGFRQISAQFVERADIGDAVVVAPPDRQDGEYGHFRIQLVQVGVEAVHLREERLLCVFVRPVVRPVGDGDDVRLVRAGLRGQRGIEDIAADGLVVDHRPDGVRQLVRIRKRRIFGVIALRDGIAVAVQRPEADRGGDDVAAVQFKRLDVDLGKAREIDDNRVGPSIQRHM